MSHHHPDPNQRGDFPLTETLEKLNSGRNLYQPIYDARVGDWNVWRPDSQMRLNILMDGALVPGSVADVGCDTGFISRALARAGHKVTALEGNLKRLAVTRYLATIKNVEMPDMVSVQLKLILKLVLWAVQNLIQLHGHGWFCCQQLAQHLISFVVPL